MPTRHHLVGRAVLVQHHPRKRRTLAPTPVLAPPRRLATSPARCNVLFTQV